MLSPEFKFGDRFAVVCVGHPIQNRHFKEALGVGCDEGYAEYAVTPPKNSVKILEDVGFTEAAVATDAIATAYHAVVSEGCTMVFATVAIVGLSRLGLNGVAVVAHLGSMSMASTSIPQNSIKLRLPAPKSVRRALDHLRT